MDKTIDYIKIDEILKNTPDIREGKVNDIKQKIEKNEYCIPIDKLVEKLLKS